MRPALRGLPGQAAGGRAELHRGRKAGEGLREPRGRVPGRPVVQGGLTVERPRRAAGYLSRPEGSRSPFWRWPPEERRLAYQRKHRGC